MNNEEGRFHEYNSIKAISSHRMMFVIDLINSNGGCSYLINQWNIIALRCMNLSKAQLSLHYH